MNRERRVGDSMIDREGMDILCAYCRTRGLTLSLQAIGDYLGGTRVVPQDSAKANELYHQAGELGCGLAYYNLAVAYEEGRGVKINEKKAEHYLL